jgi:hypothetical protein
LLLNNIIILYYYIIIYYYYSIKIKSQFCVDSFQWKTLTSGLTTFLGRRREWTEAEVEAELSTPTPKKRPDIETEVGPGTETTTGAGTDTGTGPGTEDLKIHPWDSTVNLSVHQPLYPPGRVIHIVRHYPRTADGKVKKEKRSDHF